jgi:hypothetical protein
MSDPRPHPPRPLRRHLPWLVGLATGLALALFGLSRSFPPLPRELTLELKFPSGTPPRTEPLVSSGAFGQADFLVINYLDRTTATFAYDYWGFGGPTSEPVTFVPGGRHTLRVTLPAFDALVGTPKTATAPLRLEFDGRVILSQAVAYHHRSSDHLFFGENPIGGTTSGGFFRGDIFTADRRAIRGTPSGFFSAPARLRTWLATKPGEAVVAVLVGLAAAFLALRTQRWLAARRPSAPAAAPVFAGHTRPPHAWFLGTAALCALAFSAVVTGGSFRFNVPESFGSFYDHQAASLLHGRLDVPSAAVDGEAFAFEGKLYGYFGPTPALLRLPFTLFDLAFGHLSRSFLLAYYLASLAAVYALLVQASRLLSGRPTWPAPADVVLFVASAGLGSTLFFVSSRAYIYHEAIACGVAFALWSAWASLHWLAAPRSRAWLGALLLGTLSVHARPPVGLFALSLLGCVAAVHLWSQRQAGPRAWLRPIAIGLLSVSGVLSFNGLSYLKFKSFDGAPLKYHVQYHPERLARIDGKNFHLANFRYNFDGYVWRPTFLFRPTFPYFFIEGRNPNDYPRAKIDLAEPTLALPSAMPGLVVLAFAGGLFALVRWPAARRPLGVLAVAALPMTAALFMAVAISQRYTADFCPALLIAAAFGLASAELLPRPLHRPLRLGLAGLTLLSLLITAAITLHYQGEGVWGVPQDVTDQYQALRKTVDTVLGFNRP